MNYYQNSTKEKAIVRSLLFALFIIYMLLLSKYILFTRIDTSPGNYFSLKHIQTSIAKGKRTANLQPFKTIKMEYSGKHMTPEFQYENLGGNLLGFAPLAIFLPLLSRRLRSFLPVIAIVFATSLSYELIQLCTGLGIFDVDDLILNTAGGIIGFALYSLATLIYRQPALMPVSSK